jgi:hypothetical protein
VSGAAPAPPEARSPGTTGPPSWPRAVLALKARDIMGYTIAVFLVCFPVVLVLVTLLAQHS